MNDYMHVDCCVFYRFCDDAWARELCFCATKIHIFQGSNWYSNFVWVREGTSYRYCFSCTRLLLIVSTGLPPILPSYCCSVYASFPFFLFCSPVFSCFFGLCCAMCSFVPAVRWAFHSLRYTAIHIIRNWAGIWGHSYKMIKLHVIGALVQE